MAGGRPAIPRRPPRPAMWSPVCHQRATTSRQAQRQVLHKPGTACAPDARSWTAPGGRRPSCVTRAFRDSTRPWRSAPPTRAGRQHRLFAVRHCRPRHTASARIEQLNTRPLALNASARRDLPALDLQAQADRPALEADGRDCSRAETPWQRVARGQRRGDAIFRALSESRHAARARRPAAFSHVQGPSRLPARHTQHLAADLADGRRSTDGGSSARDSSAHSYGADGCTWNVRRLAGAGPPRARNPGGLVRRRNWT